MRFLVILPILTGVYSAPYEFFEHPARIEHNGNHFGHNMNVDNYMNVDDSMNIDHNVNHIEQNLNSNLKTLKRKGQIDDESTEAAELVPEHMIQNGIPVNSVVMRSILELLPYEVAKTLSQASKRAKYQITDSDMIKLDPAKFLTDLKRRSYKPQDLQITKALKYLPNKEITREFWEALTGSRLTSSIPFEYWGDEVLNQVATGKIKIADDTVSDVFKTSVDAGNLEAVKMLKDDPRVGNDLIQYALENAASKGLLEIVKLLKDDQRVPDWVFGLALPSAASNGKLEVVKLLVDDQRVGNEEIQNALRKAAYHGQVEIVKLLKDHHGVGNSNIQNALQNAALQGRLEVVKLLKDDIRVNNLDTPLVQAALNGHLEVVKLLKDDRRVDWGIDRALESAASKGRFEVVKLLINDRRVDWGINRALQSAASKGHLEIVKLLINDRRVDKKGIDLARGEAFRTGKLDVVEYLLHAGKASAYSARANIEASRNEKNDVGLNNLPNAMSLLRV